MKKKLPVIIMIALCVFSIVYYIQYQHYEKKQREAHEYNRKFKYVIYVMGYWDILRSDSTLSYEERYYQEMLQDQELSLRVDYLNYYIQKDFSDISYQEITMDELKNSPIKVYEKMQCLMDDLSKKGEDLQKVFIQAYMQIREDQTYIMQYMGYKELAQEFADNKYPSEYYEEQFLGDKKLPVRLEKLNQVIATELTGKYEEITIERIVNNQLQVIEELHEIEEIYPDIRNILLQS